jgi:hypothetical protein
MSKRVVQGFGAFASVVALLVAVTSLVDWVSSAVDDPKPRPPPHVDARIVDVAYGEALRLGDYLTEIRELALLRQLTDFERDEPGLGFLVRVRLQGGLGERFPFLWTLHRAGNGERLESPTYNQPASTSFTPSSGDHSRSWPIWVPYPPRTGRYFLRAVLTDHKGQPVDELDSEPVELTEIPG